MRDEEVGEIQFALELLQQIHDLRLNRNVERRDRFVGDDKVGVGGERARDADALPLPAGKFVRVALYEAGTEADRFHQLADSPLALRAGRDDAESFEWLAQNLSDGHPRIERRIRVLKDHLQVTPLAPHFSLRKMARSRPRNRTCRRSAQSDAAARAQELISRSPTRRRGRASRPRGCRARRRPPPSRRAAPVTRPSVCPTSFRRRG